MIHPVDLIPKRKAESVIRREIEEYYERRAKDIPANRGVDRANLVRKLQDKFKMQRGILPKGAELPGLDVNTKFDEEMIKQNAKLKVDKKGQTYSHSVVLHSLYRKSRISNPRKSLSKNLIRCLIKLLLKLTKDKNI